RAVCRYFHNALRPLSREELLEAESQPFATTHQLYVCAFCGRMRPAGRFADDMQSGIRGKTGWNAATRSCLDCGLQRRGGAQG
ncbi:hypothetical protein BJ878DRAFT_387260, partial [Calycina marina]